MALLVHDPLVWRHAVDRLTYGRQILRSEAAALEQVADRLDDSFLQAVESRTPSSNNCTDSSSESSPRSSRSTTVSNAAN